MILSFIIKLLSKIFLLTGRLESKNAFSKPLSPEEEAECFARLKNGDKEAEEKLLSHNLRLVAHIVKKYQGSSIEQDELISVGSIGLMKAVSSFDTDKGHSFSTYAARCIQNEILMLLRSQKKFQAEVSIDEKIGTDKDGNEISLIDILQDSSAPIDEKASTKVLYDKVVEIINTSLSKREREIMYFRYGIGGTIPMTQNEIAKMLGISRSYISRIEKKALEQIRSANIKL